MGRRHGNRCATVVPDLQPERQRERFDLGGSYCSEWLPEWATFGYPEPMIDLAAEAAEAKERFKAASR
jgi:deoxyribodipyrimidine photolyase